MTTDRRSAKSDTSSRRGPLLAVMPWPLAASLAAVITAVVGLLPPIALAVVGWVEAPDVGFWSTVGLGTRGWLLAHGAATDAGAVHISMIPLGVTALMVVTGSGLAGQAAKRARAEAAIELSQRDRRSLTLRVGGVYALAYVLCVLVASGVADLSDQTGRALLGAVVVGMLSGLVGAGRALDWHPTAQWPAWARAIPRAVTAALAVVLASGAVVVLIALLTHVHQVVALHDSLVPGVGGGIVLLLLQLAWLPNLVIWGGSWVLGAGFRVGQGTLVSPSYNLTGMLPDIPVLGAIGPNGPGHWWTLSWLACGVLAGGVAAWIVVRSLDGTGALRADAACLVGGLSGAAAGLCFVALAALSNGALGVGRLTQMGARLAPLSVMAPVLMGLSGLVVGLTLGLIRPGGRAATLDADGAAAEDHATSMDEEVTVVVD